MNDSHAQHDSQKTSDTVSQILEKLSSGELACLADLGQQYRKNLTAEQLWTLIGAEKTMKQTVDQDFDEANFAQPEETRQWVGREKSEGQIEATRTAARKSDKAGRDVSEAQQTRRPVRPGERVDDFELLAELGKGSFATVFLARQISMQRLVALKVSVDHGTEAQTLAQLDHPNIVRVYDQRREPNFDLLYMQYLQGGTLQDVLRAVQSKGAHQLSGKAFVECVDQAIIKRGDSPQYDSPLRKFFLAATWPQTICRIGHQLAAALDYAHRKGVLHRDIKPANVLVASDYSVKLADFNISSADGVNGDSRFGGSLAYMSPEQLKAFDPTDEFNSEQLTCQSDVYSLAVLLYQLLTLELPFALDTKARDEDLLKSLLQARMQSLPQIRERLGTTSPLLQTALIASLQPSQDMRIDSAAALANRLKIGLDGQAEQILFPPDSWWTALLENRFLTSCFGLVFAFNALAALFVFNFNLADAVPDQAKSVFTGIMWTINGVFFPLALVVFAYWHRSVPIAINASNKQKFQSADFPATAVRRLLSAGDVQAMICVILWLAAGILYPSFLSLFGVSLTLSDWTDFLASHWLAGISITALTFFATTYLSLRVWLPILIQESYADTMIESLTNGLKHLLKRIPVYQFLAAAVPLLAIALLVMFGEQMTRSKFPLKVISVFGLLTIPIVMLGGNRIAAICERLLSVYAKV